MIKVDNHLPIYSTPVLPYKGISISAGGHGQAKSTGSQNSISSTPLNISPFTFSTPCLLFISQYIGSAVSIICLISIFYIKGAKSIFCIQGNQSWMSYARDPQPLGYRLATPVRSWSLLKLMFIESVIPSNHLIFCHPLLLLPSILPSIRVFSNESVLRIGWPKYQSFNFSISLSSECSGLSSLRIDWFDLLAVQGTLKSLFQHYSSEASILRRSAFFMAQFSHPYHSFDQTDLCWQSNVSVF